MRNGWMLIAAMTVGCAAAPPRVEVPEPCACPKKTTTAPQPAFAFFTSSGTDTPAPSNAVQVDDVGDRFVDALVDHNVLSFAAKARTNADATRDAAIASLVTEHEITLLRRVHEAREFRLRDDGTPTAEREFVMREMFVAAIVELREAVAKGAEPIALEALLRAPGVKAAIDATLPDLFYIEPGPPLSAQKRAEYLAKLWPSLTAHLAPLAREFAEALADAAIECRRGKWVAVLNGKI